MNTYDRPVHAGWTICPALFGHVDYHSHNGYRDRVVENSWIDGYSYYKHKGRPIITVNVVEDNAVRKQLRVVATFVGYGGAGLDDHYDIDHKKDRTFTCYADGSVFIKDVDVIDTYDLPSGGTGEGKYTFIHATVNSLVRTNNASVPERNLFTSQFGTMNPRTVGDGWYKPVQPWVCQFGGPQTWMNYLLTVYSADQNQFDSMRMHCLHYCVRAGWAWGPLGPGFPMTPVPAGSRFTNRFYIQMGTRGSPLLPDFAPAVARATKMSPTRADEYANAYRSPGQLALTKGSRCTTDPEDRDHDGFNEGEGCYVMDNGPGGVSFSIDGSTTHRPNPRFKVRNWTGPAPSTIACGAEKLAAKTAFLADVQGGVLLIQIFRNIDDNRAISVSASGTVPAVTAPPSQRRSP